MGFSESIENKGIFTDIIAGNRSNVYTILVKAIGSNGKAKADGPSNIVTQRGCYFNDFIVYVDHK